MNYSELPQELLESTLNKKGIKQKDLLTLGVVYEIKCCINQKRYVGKTYACHKDYRSRFVGHKNSLKRGCHSSRQLQHDWDTYGEHQFTFTAIDLMVMAQTC
jgi:hypothetical protein